MMILHKARMTTIGLGILNTALLTLLVLIVRWGQDRVQAPEQLPARHLAETDLSLLSVGTLPSIDVAAIRDNAVFYAHRTFFQPPTPGQSVPVPEYEFAGSIGLPQGKRVAFVKRKSDKTNRTVHVGDDLDGWRVESIAADRVVIVREADKLELKSATESQASGLVRGTVTPYVAQSGLRTLGAPAAIPKPPQAVAHEARTYSPPPNRN